MLHVPLCEVAKINPGIPEQVAADPNARVSFLPMAAVSERGRITAAEERCVGEVIKGYRYFEEGDVLIAKITPCMENGKAAIAEKLPHRIGFGSTEFHVLRPLGNLHNRYLFYAIWNPKFRHAAENNMTGTAGQKRVPADFLERVLISLPPLSEQKRIAAILDKADVIRRRRLDAVKTTDKFLRSVFHHMFGEFLRDDQALGSRCLGDFIDDARGISYGIVQRGVDVPQGVPVVRINNIVSNEFQPEETVRTSKEISAGYQRTVLRGGELLISIRGTVGRVAEVTDAAKGWNVSREIAIIPIKEGEIRSFFKYLILSESSQRFLSGKIKGVAQRGINLSDLRRLPVPNASIQKQKAFDKIAKKSLDDHRIRVSAYQCAEELFASVQQRAFSAQLLFT